MTWEHLLSLDKVLFLQDLHQNKAGDYHSCGQEENGFVTCWGDENNGRLDVPTVVFDDFDMEEIMDVVSVMQMS